MWDESKDRVEIENGANKHHAHSSYREIRVELVSSSLLSGRKINTRAGLSPVAYHSQKREFPWISKDSRA